MVWRSLRALWRLAWPLALVQFNNNLTGAVDTAFAGRVSQDTLGATGLGAAVFVVMSVLGLGAGMGADPLAAQAFGAGQPVRARRVLWQGLWVALASALPLTVGTLWMAAYLPAFGVSQDVAAGAHAYLLGRVGSLPVYCVVGVLRSYLQGAQATRAVLVSALAMNALNVALDALFLFGDPGLVWAGLPAVGLMPMGPFGLGLASAIAAYLQLGILLVAVRRVSLATAGQSLGHWRPHGATLRKIGVLGLPAALQMLTEVGIFTLIAILMGGMGAMVSAAHHAAMMLISLSFSLCVGIAAATSVFVGRAVGRNDQLAARSGGIAGLVLGGCVMAASTALMWLCPCFLARLMTQDPDVVAVVQKLVFIAGFFQLADGVQVVAAGALRGAGSTRYAFVANVVGFWGIGLPIGWYLSYGLNMGPTGLWWGLTAGLGVVAVVLCRHFLRLSQRAIAPIVGSSAL